MTPDLSSRLYVRKPTDNHKSRLINASKLSAELSQIITATYQHQPAVYTIKEEDQLSLELPEDEEAQKPDPLTQRIAHNFYTNCFIPPQVHRGKTQLGESVLAETFLSETAKSTRDSHRNNLHFLLGEVGVGKTAFINYLLTTKGEELTENGRWFIRVDIDTAGKGKPLSRRQLLDRLVRKTIKVFQKRPFLLCTNTRDTRCHAVEEILSQLSRAINPAPGEQAQGLSDNEIEHLFCNLVRAMDEICGRRLFLVLDNFDYLAHLFDRYQFTPIGAKDEAEQMEIVRDFVCSFFHEDPSFGSLGVDVLFVMRADTYQTIAPSGITSLPETSLWHERNAYFLVAPPWQDVLAKRNELLSFAANIHNKSLTPSVEQFVKIVRQQIDHPHRSEMPLLGHLRQLNNHGLRDLMSFFAQYAWVSHDEDGSQRLDVLQRFGDHEAIALLVYMLDGLARFSQTRAHFPNIFLVNATEIQHGHSYWLKRLILDYLYKMHKLRALVDPSYLFNLFSGDGGYSQDLVRIALGSMGNVNGSNLIKVERSISVENSITITQIELTARAIHCIERLFHRYFYLELVVEDELLPVPFELATLFYQDEKTPDYFHLVSKSSEEYFAGAMAMLQRKANQVVRFVDLLCASYEIERRKYSKVFDTLNRQGVSILNPYELRDSVLNEIEKLNERLGRPIKLSEFWDSALRQRVFDGFLTPIYSGN